MFLCKSILEHVVKWQRRVGIIAAAFMLFLTIGLRINPSCPKPIP